MKPHQTVPPPAAEPGTSSEVELAQALDAYMAAVEAGRSPDPEQLLAEHPAVADRLRACLASLRLVERAAGSLAGAAEDGEPADAGRPEVLGDFRILREVGRGGMGVVYEAEQVSLGRRVALKVLPLAATMDARQLQRFHNEARAAAGLHHTNIVPVYAVGCERGVHYYAMQFIEGRTLADVIAQQRREGVQQMPTTPEAEAAASATTAPPAAQATSTAPRDGAYFRRAAEWGIQAAEALDCAHALGVVHRDVKPGNLLVDAAGRLWVTDFGLAQVQSDARLTLSGDLVGTLRYMSPEQALAKRVVIDHRTDVYSLGATLYELLTLQPPYSGNDRQELLRQIAFEEPRSLRRINRAIPGELETIVLKALEKNPAERYGTAQEMGDDLERYLRNEPIRARRPSLVQRLRKWGRRHRAVTVAAVAVLAVVAAVASVGYAGTALALGREAEAHKDADNARRRETEEHRLAERQRDSAREQLYISDIRQAQAAWEIGDTATAQDLLERHRPAEGLRDLRGWEWYYLQGMCHKALLTCHEGPSSGSSLVLWSPDGRCLATNSDENGTISIRDALTGKIEMTLHAHTGSNVYSMAWKPDGSRLASCDSGDGRIEIWNVSTGLVESTLQTQMGGVERVVWSPDGRQLVAAHAQGFKVWDVTSGKEVFSLWPVLAGQPASWIPGKAVAWSPKGDRLAAGNWIMTDESYTVKIWDTTSWQEVAKIHRPVRPPVFSLAWSPDARQLAIGTLGPPTKVEVVDAMTGKEVFPLPDAALTAVWSPDGQRLASPSGNQLQFIKVWDAATGKLLLTLRGHTQGAYQVNWNPDGGRIASTSQWGEIKVWDTTCEQERLVVSGHAGPVLSLAWSRDGTRLASGGADGTVKVWDVSRDKPELTLTGSEGAVVTGIAWSPDGRQLASADGSKVRVWDAHTGTEARTLVGTRLPRHSMAGVGGLAWSPDGRWLASEHPDGTLKVWEPSTGQELLGLDMAVKLWRPAWSPDGKWLVAGGMGMGGTIYIWDTATWQPCLPLPGHVTTIQALAWSPDSQQVASAGDRDKTVKIWDLAKREVISTLRGHTGMVHAIGWSPDGRRLATAGDDSFVKIWDPTTGQVLLDLHEQARAVVWSPDGRRLVCGTEGGTLNTYDASAGFEVPSPAPATDQPDHRADLAEIQMSLASALIHMSRLHEAEAAFRQALAIQERLIGEFPDVRRYRLRFFYTSMLFGEFLGKSGQPAAAEQIYRRALGFATVSPADDGDRSYQVRLRFGLGSVLQKMGLLAAAAEEYLQVTRLDPRDAQILNNIAWFLASCPDPRFRDPAQAVQLAKRATGLAPREGDYWNTLGVASYRAGDLKGALQSLGKSAQLRSGGNSFDYFFLAMARWQLGQKDEAGTWYGRGVEWMDKNKPQDAELLRFRAEATDLLGIKEQPPEQDKGAPLRKE
jgi:WD40 repeat protein/serine/threonine protein kinase/tetratricopeptide (TPR) repeat protein